MVTHNWKISPQNETTEPGNFMMILDKKLRQKLPKLSSRVTQICSPKIDKCGTCQIQFVNGAKMDFKFN